MLPLINVSITGGILIGVALAAIAIGYTAHRRQETIDSYDNEAPIVTVFVGTLAGTLGIIVLFFGLIPFNAKYYPIVHRTGVVSEVSNQFVTGSGKDTDQAFVLTLKGDDTAYVLDDPRVSMLNGRRVNLACTIEWVPNGADRWNCIIGNP